MENQFSVGEKVVYPTHGIAEVVGVEEKSIGDTSISVYVLRSCDKGLTIIVPKEKTEMVGLRPLLSKEEIVEMFHVLSSKEEPGEPLPWNRRQRVYADKIKTGDAFEIAEVVRDISLIQQNKSLSYGERKVLEKAESLLASEISATQEISKTAAIEKMHSLFSAMQAA